MNAMTRDKLPEPISDQAPVIETYDLYPVAGFIYLVSYLAAALVR